MKQGILLFFGMLLIATATAQTEAPTAPVETEQLLEHPEQMAELYNQHADSVPRLVKSIINNERINLRLDTGDETLVYGMTLDGTQITNVTEGGVDNPTLTVSTSYTTIESIIDADDPRYRAVQALNQDEITYEAHGLFRKITVGVLSTLAKLFSVLY